MPESPYNATFYRYQSEGSYISARRVLPFVFDILKPKSIIDFGCGVGTWLKACTELGALNVCGLDGDYVDQEMLLIDKARFIPTDLTSLNATWDPGFDMAISLEVAEHLPAAAAANFVRQITQASDVALFGAAIPFQGGTNHVNEQWPDYWSSHFSNEGYSCFDLIRQNVWNDHQIEVWYRQNTFVYARTNSPAYVTLVQAGMAPVRHIMNAVHPDMYLRHANLYMQAEANLSHSQSNFHECHANYKKVERILFHIIDEMRQRGITVSLPGTDNES